MAKKTLPCGRTTPRRDGSGRGVGNSPYRSNIRTGVGRGIRGRVDSIANRGRRNQNR